MLLQKCYYGVNVMMQWLPSSSYSSSQHSIILLQGRSLSIVCYSTLRSAHAQQKSLSTPDESSSSSSGSQKSRSIILSSSKLKRKGEALFVPPGLDPSCVTDDMVLPCSNIAVGRDARHIHIKDVQFVKSSTRSRDCPNDHRPEIAVLGRSNVGKSSLINSLVLRNDIALTSKKPGKTQVINHFLVNKSWFLVDLPGYGFGKAAERAREEWSSFTKGYLLNRSTLIAVLLLIDSTTPPHKIDLDCANWLGRVKIPHTFVFTKCDKMKRGRKGEDNMSSFLELLGIKYSLDQPPWIMTSSLTGMGRPHLLRYISHLLNYWNSPPEKGEDEDEDEDENEDEGEGEDEGEDE